MKTIEIIRNGLMQCIETIGKLIDRMSNAEATMKKQEEKINGQENKIKDAKVSLSVMENFASSQFANFTYLYYEERGEIKSILFNDGNVDSPNVPNYTISGKPVSYRCHSNTSKVVFKDFDTSAVTDMSRMFYYCINLTALDVSNFNTSSVTNMSYMFAYCFYLTTLDLSNFNTSSVTNMTYMFQSCGNLTTLIGTHTLEEVQGGTIKALKGTKVSLDLSSSSLLERASILALFYGLADLTGQTAQTVTLHSTAKARLTAEDIKIATDKNWKVQ